MSHKSSRGMQSFHVLVAAAISFLAVASSSALNKSCSSGNSEDDSLIQVNQKHSDVIHRGCQGDIVQAAVDEVFKMTTSQLPLLRVTKADLETVFSRGCDQNQPSTDRVQCDTVKQAMFNAYHMLLSKSHEHMHKHGFGLLMSFEEAAVLQMFACVYWNNGEDTADTCTEEKLCNMVTNRSEYDAGKENLFAFDSGLANLQINGTTRFESWGNGWPGSGEVHPIVRVSLLHKSDGTNTAQGTILGTSGLRLSVINGGWAKAANLLIASKYAQDFQIAWGPIRDGMLSDSSVGGPPLTLQSGLASIDPGKSLSNFSDTAVVAKMPPPAGRPITMAIIGDPCVGNMLGGGQCVLRAYYGVNRTLPALLNAVLPSCDVWYLTGDNFYDRYGPWTVGVFAQLSEAAQGTPLITTPGNHDYFWEGIPSLSTDNDFTGYDQLANGFAQFYAQDTEASFQPAAPPQSLISGGSNSDFASGEAFIDFSADPGSSKGYDAKPSNFNHYSIAGNVGLVVFTCVGQDPRSFVSEACTFMKQENPDLVLFMGHYNKAGDGCAHGTDPPTVAKWALDHSDCAAFKGSGRSPYGPSNMAATRLKFVVGHQHCNCMTTFDLTLENKCLSDDADPGSVDGFIIGSHGMSWDPQSDPVCSARFGLPVLSTDNGNLTVSYAKLSLDTTKTHCSALNPFCHASLEVPGEISRMDLWSAFLGSTPTAWEPGNTGRYGAGILTDAMDSLLACLSKDGTLVCSKNISMFDVWYSKALV